jgi:hypothetical protein
VGDWYDGDEMADMDSKDYAVNEEVGDAIWKHHYDLKKEISTSKKLNDIKDEDFSNIQEYFKDRSVENTIMAFKIRSHMVTEIPCNFKNKYKKKGNDGLICAYCSENEDMDQSHCMRCPAWSELRKDLEAESVKLTALHDSED